MPIFKKGGGLTGSHYLEGFVGKEGGDFFRRGCSFYIKTELKSEIFNNKKKFINKNVFLWQKRVPLFTHQMLFFFFFCIGIYSMQGWTATTRHGATRKRNTKRFRHTGNLFRKNLQSKDVFLLGVYHGATPQSHWPKQTLKKLNLLIKTGVDKIAWIKACTPMHIMITKHLLNLN